MDEIKLHSNQQLVDLFFEVAAGGVDPGPNVS